MNVLSDYDEYVRVKVVNQNFKILIDYVQHAFYPFRPGVVTTYISDFNRDVTIEFENFPNYKLTVSLDSEEYMTSNQIHDYIGRKALEIIRNEPRTEPPDNIVLGEY